MPEVELLPALSQPRVFPLTWFWAFFLPPLPPAGVWNCAFSHSLSLGCTLLQLFLLRGVVWMNWEAGQMCGSVFLRQVAVSGFCLLILIYMKTKGGGLVCIKWVYFSTVVVLIAKLEKKVLFFSHSLCNAAVNALNALGNSVKAAHLPWVARPWKTPLCIGPALPLDSSDSYSQQVNYVASHPLSRPQTL